MASDRDKDLELPDPKVVARKVRIRRIKRRIKAAVSLGIAVVAGTYIACSGEDKNRPNPAPNPSTPEGSNLPAPPDASVAADASASLDASAPPDTALVKVDAGAKRDGGVDRTEHRKGMPVPDNLLE